MTRIDLHMHSTASDGVLSPAEVVRLAQERGLTTIALTDHDTTAGWDEAMAVVTACFKDLEKDCPRIGVNLKVDWKKGGASRLTSKIDSVEKVVGRKLKT